MSLLDLINNSFREEVEVYPLGIENKICIVDTRNLKVALEAMSAKLEKLGKSPENKNCESNSERLKRAKGSIMSTILVATSGRRNISHAELADRIIASLQEVGIL